MTYDFHFYLRKKYFRIMVNDHPAMQYIAIALSKSAALLSWIDNYDGKEIKRIKRWAMDPTHSHNP
jgi:hypothetical protein